MKVQEILAEASPSPRGVAFEIFTRMLPTEVTRATLREVDAALRWLARTAKTSPSVVEDIASSLVAGSKHMGITVREMAQMAEPQLLRAGIDPADVNRALDLAEKLAEPSLWSRFKDLVGAGSKKEPKVEPTPGTPTTPTTPTAPGAPSPTPAPAAPTAPAAPAGSTRVAELSMQSAGKKFLEKFDPRLMSKWQIADAIAMAYGIIEPWYTFKKDAEWAVGAFTSKAKNPDGSLIFATKEDLSKGVQIAAQEAMGQTLALLAGRKLIGYFTGVNRIRALPSKTQEEIRQMYSKLGAKGQVAFAAWLDSPPGRQAFDGWLWGQLYSQTGTEDTRPELAMSVNSLQGQVAWAMRQVSGYLGGFVKSFYDGALRSAGGIDSQGNTTAQAQQQQQAAAADASTFLGTTTEKK